LPKYISRPIAATPLQLRAGFHSGEYEVRGDDIGGITVHIGARVSALAGPNDVLVSSTLRDLVSGQGSSSNHSLAVSACAPGDTDSGLLKNICKDGK
jgi:class 3 adenylate cyclase